MLSARPASQWFSHTSFKEPFNHPKFTENIKAGVWARKAALLGRLNQFCGRFPCDPKVMQEIMV
jgi:hypothetical protein